MAEAVISEARAAGLELWVEGEWLRFRGPREAVAALRPMLAEHKAELLAALRSEPEREEPAPTQGPCWRPRWYALASETLGGEAIVVIRDETSRSLVPDRFGEAVVYLESEARSLAGIDPHSLRIIHEMKRRGAEVIERTPAPNAGREE